MLNELLMDQGDYVASVGCERKALDHELSCIEAMEGARAIKNLNGNGYSVLYETPDTRALDRLFGLTGGRPEDSVVTRVREAVAWIPAVEVRFVMRHFADMAIHCGRFVGLLANEIENATGGRVPEAYIKSGIESGYVQDVELGGRRIVAPTLRYC